ncbi:MAG: winged helix-turn-helix transcriptional regulator [Promethearchaeota archaeon]
MSITNFIRKKGNFEILKVLKIKNKNYNSIKKEIVSFISPRTLDYRLRELVQMGIIQYFVFEENKGVKKKYSLTRKGIFILTMFEILDNLIKSDIFPKLTHEIFLNQLNKNLNLNFGEVWKKLKDILKKEKIIYTLKQKKPNKIVNFNDTSIFIETEKGNDKIRTEIIEDAWYNFVNDGILYRNEHNKASYRSSFIFALFSKLPFVKVSKNPPLFIKLALDF